MGMVTEAIRQMRVEARESKRQSTQAPFSGRRRAGRRRR